MYGPSDPSDMSFCLCSDKLWECRESSMMSPFLSLPPKPQGRIFRFFRSVSDTNRCPQDLGASEQPLRGPTEAPSLGCSGGESTTHHSHMCWCVMGLGDCWCYSLNILMACPQNTHLIPNFLGFYSPFSWTRAGCQLRAKFSYSILHCNSYLGDPMPHFEKWESLLSTALQM